MNHKGKRFYTFGENCVIITCNSTLKEKNYAIRDIVVGNHIVVFSVCTGSSGACGSIFCEKNHKKNFVERN